MNDHLLKKRVLQEAQRKEKIVYNAPFNSKYLKLDYQVFDVI